MNETINQASINILQYGVLGSFSVILLGVAAYLFTVIRKQNKSHNIELSQFFEKLLSITNKVTEAVVNNTATTKELKNVIEKQSETQGKLHDEHKEIINTLCQMKDFFQNFYQKK